MSKPKIDPDVIKQVKQDRDKIVKENQIVKK